MSLEAAKEWGGEGWFLLGDLDLGLHLVRTQALRTGDPLSLVTERLVRAARLELTLLPATDDELRTHVVTPGGRFSFQEWFVGRRHADEVDAIELVGADAATPAPGVIEAITEADVIVFAPSNPFVSLEPILAVAPIAEAIRARTVPCIAVSPLIGGAAVKGPLDRMLKQHDRRGVTGGCRRPVPGLARRCSSSTTPTRRPMPASRPSSPTSSCPTEGQRAASRK